MYKFVITREEKKLLLALIDEIRVNIQNRNANMHMGEFDQADHYQKEANESTKLLCTALSLLFTMQPVR